jgi:hypothetical protein
MSVVPDSAKREAAGNHVAAVNADGFTTRSLHVSGTVTADAMLAQAPVSPTYY